MAALLPLAAAVVSVCEDDTVRVVVVQPGAAGSTTEAGGHAVLPPPDLAVADPEMALPNVYGNVTGGRHSDQKHSLISTTASASLQGMPTCIYGMAGHQLHPATPPSPAGPRLMMFLLLCSINLQRRTWTAQRRWRSGCPRTRRSGS